MRLCVRMLFAAFLAITISACSGGAVTETPSAPPQPDTAGTDSAIRSVQLGLQPITVEIPVVADIAGSVDFPAVNSTATLDLSASTVAPDGVVPASVRHAQGLGTLTVYEYVFMTPKVTITLPSVPAMHFTYPTTTPLAGKTFSYGITDPNSQGGLFSFDTEGPGTVRGNTVSFPAVATSVTLLAGHKYTFIVYATAAIAGSKIYIANRGNNTITTYTLDGTPATPTIKTGVNAPTGVTVDSAGKIYVLNAGSNSITTYNSDGSQTKPTITAGLNGPLSIGVDASGKIYVLNGNTYAVTTYFANGSAATPTISGLNQPSAMAVDAAGKVYIANYGYRTFDSGFTTYNPDGSLGTPQVVAAYQQPGFIAVDSKGKIYVDYSSPGILTDYNANGSANSLSIPTAIPSAFAVDTAGKIYSTNASANTVNTYDASGQPTTPTITAGLSAPSAIAVH